MDDLNGAINSILGDPDKLEQLRAVAESLGINTGGGMPPPAQTQSAPAQTNANAGPGGFDTSALASLMQSFQGGGAPSGGGSANTNAGGFPNMDVISKIAGIMGTFNQSDKNVDLLRALRPHFNPARAGRIDDAVRIMQLLKVWPSVRDSGLLSSLGNLGGLGNLFGGGGR